MSEKSDDSEALTHHAESMPTESMGELAGIVPYNPIRVDTTTVFFHRHDELNRSGPEKQMRFTFNS